MSRTISLSAASLLALIGSAALAQAQYDGIIHDPSFPAPGSTESGGTSQGGWTSVQLGALVQRLPYGSAAQGHVGLAVWDFFPAGAFNGFGPQYVGSGVTFSAELYQFDSAASWSSTAPVISVPGGVDVGGRIHFADFDFMLEGTADQALTSISITLLHTPYMLGDGSFDTPFQDMELDINGATYTPVFTTYDTIYGPSEAGTSVSFRITEFRWDIDIAQGDEFAFFFSQEAAYFSLDTIALHGIAQPIPEPGTYALLGVGGLFLAARLRKRRSPAPIG